MRCCFSSRRRAFSSRRSCLSVFACSRSSLFNSILSFLRYSFSNTRCSYFSWRRCLVASRRALAYSCFSLLRLSLYSLASLSFSSLSCLRSSWYFWNISSSAAFPSSISCFSSRRRCFASWRRCFASWRSAAFSSLIASRRSCFNFLISNFVKWITSPFCKDNPPIVSWIWSSVSYGLNVSKVESTTNGDTSPILSTWIGVSCTGAFCTGTSWTGAATVCSSLLGYARLTLICGSGLAATIDIKSSKWARRFSYNSTILLYLSSSAALLTFFTSSNWPNFSINSSVLPFVSVSLTISVCETSLTTTSSITGSSTTGSSITGSSTTSSTTTSSTTGSSITGSSTTTSSTTGSAAGVSTWVLSSSSSSTTLTSRKKSFENLNSSNSGKDSSSILGLRTALDDVSMRFIMNSMISSFFISVLALMPLTLAKRCNETALIFFNWASVSASAFPWRRRPSITKATSSSFFKRLGTLISYLAAIFLMSATVEHFFKVVLKSS